MTLSARLLLSAGAPAARRPQRTGSYRRIHTSLLLAGLLSLEHRVHVFVTLMVGGVAWWVAAFVA